MSMAALLLATRDRIRSVLGLDASHCEVTQASGRPPAVQGEYFISVHWGAWSFLPAEGLAEKFSVAVTVTCRVGAVPQDRVGTDLEAVAGTGLDALCRKVLCACFLDKGGDAVLNGANAYLGTGVNGFVVPAVEFSVDGQPTERGPDWFSGGDYEGGPYAMSGESLTLRLASFERYQTIESMT